MLEVGTHVAERYIVEALIGSGGLAHVYRVRHIELGSAHALKVLAWDTPALAARMLQEGRIQAQLRHPNLVRVTDVLRDGSLIALLMDYIEGDTLEQHIHQNGPMELDVLLRLMAPVLGAVAVAHDAQVLHRDLKPANVLLERFGSSLNPKVMDFGIAKALADSGDGATTRPNAILGTPEYMAPEQFLDAGMATAAVDVFALGVTIQFCLTGEGAFEPTGADRPLIEQLMRTPRPLPDDLPDSVAGAIGRAMSTEPSDRFADARAFAQALFRDYPALLAHVGDSSVKASGLDPQAFTTGAAAQRVGQPNRHVPSPTLTPVASAAFEPPALRRSKAPLLLAALLVVGVGGLMWWWMDQNPAVSDGPVYEPVTDVVGPTLPPPDGQTEGVVTADVVEGTDVLAEGSEVSADTDVPAEPVTAGVDEPPQDAVADVAPVPPIEDAVDVDTDVDTEAVDVDTEATDVDTEAAVVPERVVMPALPEPVTSVVSVADAVPEPEVQRVDLAGRWVGTADGRPLILSLRQGIDGTVTGDVTFTLGTTQRSFPVIGTVSGERVTLDASGAFRFVGALRSGTLGGTYTARQRSRSFPWTASRD